ncbi:MAG: MMPL family transporter [Methanobacteriota archaeon]
MGDKRLFNQKDVLQKLGRIIEKRPWHVVILIVLITIGFSLFIPSLEFKTDFADFAPDNELVKANNRITEYFGTTQQIMLLLIDTENTDSVLTPQALRDQYALQKELVKNPDVNSSVSITTFVDTICQMEFGESLENCTDEQLETAVQDLLTITNTTTWQLLQTNDPNEDVDYPGRTRLSRGKAVESTDIKNCYLSKDNSTLLFTFEVYDLSTLETPLQPPFPKVNIMEWYLQFTNVLLPEDVDIQYKIAVRIEPAYPLWEIGRGIPANLQQLISHLRDHNLLTAYTTRAYLWLKPPGQTMSFSIPLTTGNITIDATNNNITLSVSRKELGDYGIAPQFGSFEVPAKLSDFLAGVRYYQSPILHRPGGRITINTSYLFDRIEQLHNRPILGGILTRLLQKYGGLTWDQYENLTQTMTATSFLPDTLSLSAIETLWVQTDHAPDTGVSDTIFPLIPKFFDDLRVNALSFISADYKETKHPKSSLIIIQLESTSSDTAETARVSNTLLKEIAGLDTRYDSISIQVTGEGIVSTQINQVTMDANTIIGPMIFVLILCILFIAFRKPSYVFLPIIVFAFSCIWLFGTMALLGISFSIIAVALLPLNIGLGVEYSVNLLHNYRIEIEKGRTPAEAIRLSIKDIGVAIFLAWFTTFVAFLSFLSASIPPIRDFGIFLALGITYTFIITMTLLTSLRYIIDRRKQAITVTGKKQTHRLKNVLADLACILLRHQKKVFVITIIICLFMGTAISQLKTGFSMSQFIPQDNPALTLFDRISEDFPFSSQDQEFILLEGDIATTQALQGLASTHENMNNDQFIARKTDGSPKTQSIYTIIQQVVANNRTLITLYDIDETTSIPRTDQQIQALYTYLMESNEYGMQVKSVLHEDNGGYTAAIIRVYIDLKMDTEDMTGDFEHLKKELNNDLADLGDVTSTVTGTMLITLTIMKNMTESQIVSTTLCFFLAAVMLSIIYRNPVLGLIAMIPVTISIIWVLGTMYFIGYTLNIMTITVTSITIGVGIDYACYITERFRLVADKTGDVTKAVTETISHTGNAILIAALSSMFGFGILAFAPIPPQQQFGIITAITLIYAFLTSILVLPLVLARWACWRKKRKGYIISPGAPKNLEGIDDSREYTGEQ